MILQGKAYWAKILGNPVKAFNPGEFEWAIDVAIDAETAKFLKANKVGHAIKNKGDEKDDFVTFRRKSVKQDGTPSKPVEVVDDQGQPWDQKKLIGNGSIVNVKYNINDYPKPGGGTGYKLGLISIQVWEHVPYEGGERDEFPTAKGAAEEAWA